MSDVTFTDTTTTSDTSSTLPELGYIPNPLGEAVSNAGSTVYNAFSNAAEGIQNFFGGTRLSGNISPNLAIGAGATAATAGLVYLTATNQGVQQTAQSYSQAANNLTSALNSGAKATSSILSSQYGPWIVIGGLAILAIFAIGSVKK